MGTKCTSLPYLLTVLQAGSKRTRPDLDDAAEHASARDVLTLGFVTEQGIRVSIAASFWSWMDVEDGTTFDADDDDAERRERYVGTVRDRRTRSDGTVELKVAWEEGSVGGEWDKVEELLEPQYGLQLEPFADGRLAPHVVPVKVGRMAAEGVARGHGWYNPDRARHRVHFLDRMPARAKAEPCPEAFSVRTKLRARGAQPAVRADNGGGADADEAGADEELELEEEEQEDADDDPSAATREEHADPREEEMDEEGEETVRPWLRRVWSWW